MRVRRSLPVTIDFYHFNDIVIEGGTILAMHPSSFSARYTNTIDCPVEFRMNIPTKNKLNKKATLMNQNNIKINKEEEKETKNEVKENHKNVDLESKLRMNSVEDLEDVEDELNLNYIDDNEDANFENDSDSFSFYSESEVTTIVAQSREEFLFNFIITPHKSGQTFFRIPVTTNATPPFFIHVHAHVESPNIELVDPINDYKKIESLDFQSKDEIKKSIWKKSVLLRNSGALSVTLGKFATKKINKDNKKNDFSYINYFDINSNCPQTIEPGNFCQVDVSVRLIHLRKFYEESILSIKFADYWELTCPLHIKLSKKCFDELRKMQRCATFLVLTLALIQPFLTVYFYCKGSMELQNDITNRLNNLDAERARLSMSRISAATQVIIQKADIGGGVWSPQQTESKVRLTEEAEQDLEEKKRKRKF